MFGYCNPKTWNVCLAYDKLKTFARRIVFFYAFFRSSNTCMFGLQYPNMEILLILRECNFIYFTNCRRKSFRHKISWDLLARLPKVGPQTSLANTVKLPIIKYEVVLKRVSSAKVIFSILLNK